MRSVKNISKLPRHIFISYAHTDETLANRIIADLQRENISVWVDKENLQVGTSDWERALREAIGNSFALLLLASPASRDSRYVAGELALAENLKCPIHPVWIEGDNWVDSVSLGMNKTQYIDCRRENYELGLSKLIDALKEIIASRIPRQFLMGKMSIDQIRVPRHYLCILFSTEDSPELKLVVVNPIAYNSLQSLLNDLYISYFQNQYKPLTYGQDWVLAEYGLPIGPTRVAVPWNWLLKENKGKALGSYSPQLTLSKPLHRYGLVPGTAWIVTNPRQPNHFDKSILDLALVRPLICSHMESYTSFPICVCIHPGRGILTLPFIVPRSSFISRRTSSGTFIRIAMSRRLSPGES